MFEKFRNSSLKRAVTAFGTLFNNIYIDRVNDNDEAIQTIKIPLSYAPKQKFIAKIQSTPESFEQEYQSVLPRMSFEMGSLFHDSSRKVSPMQKVRIQDSNDSNRMRMNYAPTPYNLDMNLYIYGKNQEDVLQIVEQIIPYFNPEYTLNFNSLPNLEIRDDLTIVLKSVLPEDFYEGTMSDRRMIIWTFNFFIKLNFYGPIRKQGVIKRTNVEIYTNEQMTDNLERHISYVNPMSANVNDSYEIIDYFEDF